MFPRYFVFGTHCPFRRPGAVSSTFGRLISAVSSLFPSQIPPTLSSPSPPLWLSSAEEKGRRPTLLILQKPRRIRAAGGGLQVRTDLTPPTPAVSSEVTNSLADTAFKQQRLKAWQPILTPKTVLPTLFIIGILFAPIGALLIWGNSKVCQFSCSLAFSNFLVSHLTLGYGNDFRIHKLRYR